MTALATWQNFDSKAPRQLTNINNAGDNSPYFWTYLSGQEQPTDPHLIEAWSEINLSHEDPLIHGIHAQAWARAGQKALDRKLGENDD